MSGEYSTEKQIEKIMLKFELATLSVGRCSACKCADVELFFCMWNRIEKAKLKKICEDIAFC